MRTKKGAGTYIRDKEVKKLKGQCIRCIINVNIKSPRKMTVVAVVIIVILVERYPGTEVINK